MFNFNKFYRNHIATENATAINNSEKEINNLLNILKDGDYLSAKEYLKKEEYVKYKDEIIGEYLKFLLKDGEDADFKDLNNFLYSNIINIDYIKNNNHLSLIMHNIISNLEKDKNYNAISRLENLDLIN